MSRQYDLAIIGAGAAGLIGADFAARIGARVALIEGDRIGGDCTWTGCVPSKSLLKAAHIAHDVTRAASFGLAAAEPTADMHRVVQRVHETISDIYANTTPQALRERGIDVVLGAGRFADEHTVLAGDLQISARKIIICTGARPRLPDIPGLAGVPFLTYEHLFDLQDLPRRLIVLGGGPIAVEMAQAFRRLGAGVAIVAPELLEREEPEARALIGELLSREGVELLRGVGTSVRQHGNAIEVETATGTVTGDRLLVAVGRVPRVGELDLGRAGIQHSAQGIPVDRYLRTNVRHIYACGDVIGGAQFSHLAGWQCFRAARNALLPGKSAALPEAMPVVTFSNPEVARVGLTERAARDTHGKGVHVHLVPVTRADRAVCDGEREGFVKLITGKSGRILGATIVASRAGEMINEVALAMEHGLGVSDLASAIHAYPTWSNALQLAAVDVMMTQLAGSRVFRAAQRIAGLRVPS